MHRWNPRVVALLGVVLLVVVAITVAGCGSKGSSGTSTKTGSTALGSLDKARSSLSTMAPDAKLLVVQTAQSTTPTQTPVWAYLFGSPKSDKIYVVYVTNGQSMGAQEYGTAGLSKTEWGQVPSTDAIKIDSDVALKDGLKAAGAKGDPAAYMMGLMTYKPKTDTSTVSAMTWTMQFDPGSSGASTATINVDAKTGKATVAK